MIIKIFADNGPKMAEFENPEKAIEKLSDAFSLVHGGVSQTLGI